MRPNVCLFFLIALLPFTACEKSDIEHENSFEKSYKAWKVFRESSNNSYRFVVADGSWTGSSWQTTFTVEKGDVTRRDFRYNSFMNVFRPAGGWDAQSREQILAAMKVTAAQFAERSGKELEDVLEWSEEADALGKNTQGAYPLITLDEVISSCGYINDGCQDDCFVGIGISSIEAL